MLRLTQSKSNGVLSVVQLEGKLLGPWVAELRVLFQGTARAGDCRLDLSKLLFADAAGAALLQELRREGIEIEACSPFVAELLNCPRARIERGAAP